MPTTRVLALGGSAGSIAPLLRLVAALPADLPAAVLVTVHVRQGAHSRLPDLLARAGSLPTGHARDGEELVPGRIVVAPPGAHLVLRGGRTVLDHGPRVNHVRPAVDVMLASAARELGPGVVAVVLSGALDDGAVGAALVQRAGGRVLVQDPAEADFASMPLAALAAAPGGRALGLGALAAAAAELVAEPAPGASDPSDPSPASPEPSETSMTMADSDDPGFLGPDESRLTRLSCPDCHGVLAQVDLPHISYYRCHTGHSWAPQALASAQAESTEQVLWSAVAALDEQAAMAGHLADAASADRARALAALLRDHLGRPVGATGQASRRWRAAKSAGGAAEGLANDQ